MARTLDRITPSGIAIVLAVVAGLLAIWLSLDLFPYRSINHDEGVYLHQAAMLIDGQLTIDPPVQGSLRPWFFVADDGVLYPKYAPVAAAIFAAGLVLGEPAIALGPIAAVTVWLIYAIGTELFEPRVGVVSAALLLASPFFLIQSAVFLAYLPTLMLLLVFAWAYVRADRTGDRRVAALAGMAVGLAFFSRPYTAVLFAAPFLVHAGWTVYHERWSAITRQATTAGPGLLGVGLALGYNRLLTGDPLRFPYQAFGPNDGPGFGRRELLGYVVDYDLELAFESARIALSTFATRWTVAPPVGVLLAAAGLGFVLRRGRTTDPRRMLLAGLVVSIPLGQLYFWGTHNAIGNLEDPGLGLMGHLGPFYHLPLLVPTVVFAGYAVVIGWDQFRARLSQLDDRRAAAAGLAVVVLLSGVGGLAGLAIADVVAQNRVVTESHAAAYEPFEDREFEDALVFMPTPQGNWLAHPFQYLRNDPDFEGSVVYAQDRRVFEVLEAFPERRPYRYAYNGEWFPADREHVQPTIRALRTVRGEYVTLDATMGLPPSAASVTGTLVNHANERASQTVLAVDETVDISVTFDDRYAVLELPGASETARLPVTANDTVRVTVFVDTGGLDSFEYRLELPIRRSNGTFRTISPRQRVCTDVRHCEAGGAYVPGAHGPHISLNTSLSATDAAPGR